MAAPSSAISVPAAKEQHAAYVSLLRKLLPSVHTLPPDNNNPDCCFIEDTAVVVPGTAVVVSRPGAPSRMDEVQPVAAALQQILQVTPKRIQAPGTLEGGDVLRVGRHLLVGLTKRTNPEGIQQLQQHVGRAYTVHSIPVSAGLHLKSAVTALDDTTFLYSSDAAGKGIIQHIQQLELFQAADFVEVPDNAASNVLQIGPNIVMQLGCKDTEALLSSLCKQRGLQLHKLPRMTEFIKADGSLTCLSIIC
jgi:dimethylargininase